MAKKDEAAEVENDETPKADGDRLVVHDDANFGAGEEAPAPDDAVSLLQRFVVACNDPRFSRNSALQNIRIAAEVEMRNILSHQERVDEKLNRLAAEN